MGHVPQDPVRAEGEGAHLQRRERRGTSAARVVGKSLAAQSRGRFGEEQALRWYNQRGYSLIARNWRCPIGEIDLILTAAHLVVFCEVKARASEEFGGPQAAVGWHKQRRLRRLAAMWLAEFRPAGRVDVRFDVAAVVGARVTVIEAAF
ncbi:MAG: YraN family protein [Actinobacteria bacterium]|nr:YraN family protein [Actinomycetota bacterium]